MMGFLAKLIPNGLSILAALTSALLWLWAANVKINAADFGAYGGATPESVRQFAKQTRLNSYAAMATAISVLLQVLSLSIR